MEHLSSGVPSMRAPFFATIVWGMQLSQLLCFAGCSKTIKIKIWWYLSVSHKKILAPRWSFRLTLFDYAKNPSMLIELAEKKRRPIARYKSGNFLILVPAGLLAMCWTLTFQLQKPSASSRVKSDTVDFFNFSCSWWLMHIHSAVVVNVFRETNLHFVVLGTPPFCSLSLSRGGGERVRLTGCINNNLAACQMRFYQEDETKTKLKKAFIIQWFSQRVRVGSCEMICIFRLRLRRSISQELVEKHPNKTSN